MFENSAAECELLIINWALALGQNAVLSKL